MKIAIPMPNTTPTRRSMVNEAFYAGTGPAHWQVFYDTLDRFPTTGPIPAPPQQAAVETALIKNVTRGRHRRRRAASGRRCARCSATSSWP